MKNNYEVTYESYENTASFYTIVLLDFEEYQVSHAYIEGSSSSQRSFGQN